MSQNWSRRRWLQTVFAGGAGLSLARRGGREDAKPAERFIRADNTHTAKARPWSTSVARNTTWPRSASLKKLLRDHRNGESHYIDLGLVRPALRPCAGGSLRRALRNHFRLSLSREQRQDVGVAGQRRREEITAHARRALDVRLEELLLHRPARPGAGGQAAAASGTTSARTSCISTRGRSAPGSDNGDTPHFLAKGAGPRV